MKESMQNRIRVALKMPVEADERVEKMAISKGMTKNSYMVMCIMDRLKKDELEEKMLNDKELYAEVIKSFAQTEGFKNILSEQTGIYDFMKTQEQE